MYNIIISVILQLYKSHINNSYITVYNSYNNRDITVIEHLL